MAAAFALALILLVGSAFAGIPSSIGGPGKDAASGNYFALEAYAKGSQGEDAADDVRVVPQGFNGRISYGGGAVDHTTHTVSGILTASQSFRFAVEGQNIESITYTIEGDGLQFHAIGNRSGEYGENIPDEVGTSFTVPYDEQEADWAKFTRNVEQTIPIEGDIKQAMDRTVAIDDSQRGSWDYWAEEQDKRTEEEKRLSGDAWNRQSALISYAFAQNLAKGRIVVTATFDDGSSQSKAYAFAPIEDYVTRYEELQRKTEELNEGSSLSDEEYQARAGELNNKMSQMFTVTETQL